MAQKALVTGASGLLGRAVLSAFESAGWEAIGTGLTRARPPSILKCDLSDEQSVGALLKEIKPDVIVHCAANRFPDKCDADPTAARRSNVNATQYLAHAAHRDSTLMIYISTDYVFPGPPGAAPYSASSPTAPPNTYGQTKLDGETAVLQATESSGMGVVLRVPVLYGKGERSESAVNCLMDAVWKAQDPSAAIKMDDWAQRYPTNTDDVARVCVDIAIKYRSRMGSGDRAISKLPGILQFSGEERMTKYNICETFAEIMGLTLDGMVAIKSGPNEGEVQRPFDTHLSTQELKDIGIEVRTMNFKTWWRWQVKAYRK